jgi:hypothetical protein
VEGDVHDHDALPEEHGPPDEEGRLIVEHVLPPVAGHELGNDDGDDAVGRLALDALFSSQPRQRKLMESAWYRRLDERRPT